MSAGSVRLDPPLAIGRLALAFRSHDQRFAVPSPLPDDHQRIQRRIGMPVGWGGGTAGREVAR